MAEVAACGCKVGRNAEEYGLEALDAELERRRANGASLRTLATAVNQRVLAAAIEAETADRPIDEVFGAVAGERAIEAVYEALTDEDAPERRARVETRLKQHGIDVAAVRSDWVTHPTVRTHLSDCLGIDTSREPTITAADAIDTVEWARARAAGVVGRTFERLGNAGLVSTGELDVSVTLQLTCEECGRTYRPRRLLEAGSCACHVDEPESS